MNLRSIALAGVLTAALPSMADAAACYRNTPEDYCFATTVSPPVPWSQLAASVGVTSTLVAAAGAFQHVLTVQTNPSSTGNLWLNPTGGAAVVGQGVYVAKGGGSYTFNPAPTAAINGISDSGTISVSGAGS